METIAELFQLVPGYVWLGLHVAPATCGAYHALLYKRDSRSAMGWIMACIFVPYAGPVGYFLFGINRVRTRARGLRNRFYVVDYEGGRRRLHASTPGVSATESAGYQITGRAVTEGNGITPLHSGDAAYPAMLDAISKATQHVLLSSYIFKADTTGRAFADALEAAAGRGVDVKVLIDGIGELYSFPRISTLLRRKKIATARFLAPRLLPPSIYINLRNHRKILVVDDELAFAGGMNISDDNVSMDGRQRSVSDIHFQLRGPVVSDLAQTFWNDWQFATATTHEREVIQPAASGKDRCRVVPDGPDADLDALALTIQTAFSAATHSIDIMTPYFLPGRELLAALLSAILRGVRVRIVLPQHNNLPYVHWASRNMIAELVQWNAEIYYQPGPFCHSKLLCIDDGYTLIGSANLDARSLRLNFEVGIEVFSEATTRRLRDHFAEVISSTDPTTREEMAGRSIPVRLRDSAAALFSPYL